jgi:hypothetical protein
LGQIVRRCEANGGACPVPAAEQSILLLIEDRREEARASLADGEKLVPFSLT